jgi:osmotically-inducible protein OsmY
MDHGPPESPEYLAGWLSDRLAESDVFELGITVRVAGETVFLSGVVGSEERRDHLGEFATTLVPGRTVCNEVVVVSYAEPVEQESLP